MGFVILGTHTDEDNLQTGTEIAVTRLMSFAEITCFAINLPDSSKDVFVLFKKLLFKPYM